MAGEAAISTVVELLGNLLIEKVKFLRGVEGKVELLRDELRTMQSFLRHANNKQYKDDMVRTWILDIRELAHDSQDAIEIFLAKAESRKETSKSKGMLGCISSVPKKYYYLNQTGKEIESILARLDAIDKRRERFGINNNLGEVAEPAWRLQVEEQRRLDHWQIDHDMVGVEDDIKTLLKESILNEEKKGLSVAVLEGMGGIGKSTLARAIYNHADVIAPGQFDRRGWVVVSNDFTPIETIKQLIFRLQTTEDQKNLIAVEIKRLEESTEDKLYLLQEVRHMLYKQLEGKSYLIVLDDLWDKPHFESLVTAFPHQKDKKSRILVTTRNKNIANADAYVHELKLLNSVKGWELLMKKANIGGTNGKCSQELEDVGRQILEKCNGLPLAISVVGALLVHQKTKSGWEQILDEINSYLGREDSRLSAVLELSYMSLSPQLKSCFLCLAFFKEDATVSKKELEDIWVAQGLIQREGSGRLDEIARGYLNELINRSMIQIEDLSFDDRVKSCRIHDLVRELCLRKAKEEIGLQIVKGEHGSSSSQNTYKPRHCVVYGNNLEISKQNKHVRSLFLLNVSYDDDYVSIAPTHFWSSFRLLSTLHLEGFKLRTLPDSFGLLIGLKILKIIHTGGFLELPIWFNKFKNLEVLTVENAAVEIFKFALNIEKLRHWEAFCSRGFKLESCKSLETLKSIGVEDWVEYSSTVMANCPLRELEIRMYMKPSERNMPRMYMKPSERNMPSLVRASWVKMMNLVELHINFISDFPLKEVIPQLNSLTTLRVTRHTSPICTPASMFPPNLSHLILEHCNVGKHQLIELAKLPKLQYLGLIFYRGEADEFTRMAVSRYHFPSLQVLYLQYMRKLKSIDIKQGGMPRLKQLKVHDCSYLQTQNLPQHIIISKVP